MILTFVKELAPVIFVFTVIIVVASVIGLELGKIVLSSIIVSGKILHPSVEQHVRFVFIVSLSQSTILVHLS
jgi:hypothetical protein